MDVGSKQHIARKKQIKIYRCSICTFYSPTRSVTEDHVMEHNKQTFVSNSGSEQASIAGSGDENHATYSIAPSMEREAVLSDQFSDFNVPSRKPFKCLYCDYHGRYKSHVTSHEHSQHTGEQPYKCPYCTFKTAHSASLGIHIRRHTGIRPFKCQYCSWSATESGQLVIHERKHTGAKPYQCASCNFTGSSKSAILAHRKTHDANYLPRACPKCPFRTRTLAKLRNHMKSHDLKYCHLCPFSTRDVKEFRQHKKSHTLKCRFCFKVCQDITKLKAHEATHTSDRKLRCNKCAYNTARQSLFDKHVQTHCDPDAKDGKLKCNICAFNTDRAGPMGIHMKTHKMDTIPAVPTTVTPTLLKNTEDC